MDIHFKERVCQQITSNPQSEPPPNRRMRGTAIRAFQEEEALTKSNSIDKS